MRGLAASQETDFVTAGELKNYLTLFHIFQSTRCILKNCMGQHTFSAATRSFAFTHDMRDTGQVLSTQLFLCEHMGGKKFMSQ